MHTCHSSLAEFIEQFVRVSSLLPASASWVSKSGHQAWEQALCLLGHLTEPCLYFFGGKMFLCVRVCAGLCGVCVYMLCTRVYAVEARGQHQVPSYIAFYLICLFTYSKVFILCLWVFGLPVRVCIMYVTGVHRGQKSVRSSGTEVTDVCGL